MPDANHILLVSGDSAFAETLAVGGAAGKAVSLAAIERGNVTNQSRRLQAIASGVLRISPAGEFMWQRFRNT